MAGGLGTAVLPFGVVFVHCRSDAPGDPIGHCIGRILDCQFDLGLFLLAKFAQHEVGRFESRRRLADADPQPRNLFRRQPADDVA